MNSPFQLNQTEKTIPYVLFYDREAAFVSNHWHKEVEVVYSLKGSTCMAINGCIYELREGDVAVVMSGDAHFYFRTVDHERMVVMFAPELAEACVPAGQKKELRARMKNAARLSAQWRPKHADAMREILAQLAELTDSEECGRELGIRARLYDMVLLLCNQVSRDERQSQTLEQTNQTKMLMNLEKAFAFVEENYSQDIDLSDAASALGFTSSYFARFFKKYTNSTFINYLTAFRVAKVQGMLANENKSITQIAGEAGFNSIKTFNRVFRDITGVSPSEYKRSIFEADGT